KTHIVFIVYLRSIGTGAVKHDQAETGQQNYNSNQIIIIISWFCRLFFIFFWHYLPSRLNSKGILQQFCKTCLRTALLILHLTDQNRIICDYIVNPHVQHPFYIPPVIYRPGMNLFSQSMSLSHKSLCHIRSEEHTSELQSRFDLVCRLLLENKK